MTSSFEDSLLAQGNAYKLAGNHKRAEYAYDQLLRKDPLNPFANCNLGVLRQEQGHYLEAIDLYKKALEIAPTLSVAQHNLGFAYVELGDHQKACRELSIYLDRHAKDTRALAQLCHERMCLGDWDRVGQLKDNLLLAYREDNSRRIPPFTLLSLFDDPGLICESGRRWGEAKRLQHKPSFTFQTLSNRRRKIRIGYFSSDLYAHALAQLFVGLLERHEKDEFHVVVIRVRKVRDDEMSKRIQHLADQFEDISDFSDSQAIAFCRELRLDVAVDLNGYTQSNRVQIFLARVAPLQLNFLGYPGSMGCPEFDYLVADPVIINSSNRSGYSEKIIYLPDCYQPNDPLRPCPSQVTSRGDHGLPESAIVLCCFNNSYKISRIEFYCWISLLREFDDTVLWLLASNLVFEANLRSRLEVEGISPSRVIFTPRLSRDLHLERHHHADIFLDTFNYNAHTTGSDALWMGVPVVTKAGNSFASRVGASLLAAVGLRHLVAKDIHDYLRIARFLIASSDDRLGIHRHLINNRERLALFDTNKYAQNFRDGIVRAVYSRS